MNIFFDLDGTVWDSKQRLYQLFCDLTGTDHVRFDQYWGEKMNKVSHDIILKKYLEYNEEQIRCFKYQWLKLIETKRYLNLDKIFPFTIHVLEYLFMKGYSIYFVTLRQSRAGVIDELKEKNIYLYCIKCFVSEMKYTKEEMIFNSSVQLSEKDFFIGDTGIDINVAKSLGIKSVAVLSGFRNERVLRGYNPDYILDNISGLHKIIE